MKKSPSLHSKSPFWTGGNIKSPFSLQHTKNHIIFNFDSSFESSACQFISQSPSHPTSILPSAERDIPTGLIERLNSVRISRTANFNNPSNSHIHIEKDSEASENNTCRSDTSSASKLSSVSSILQTKYDYLNLPYSENPNNSQCLYINKLDTKKIEKLCNMTTTMEQENLNPQLSTQSVQEQPHFTYPSQKPSKSKKVKPGHKKKLSQSMYQIQRSNTLSTKENTNCGISMVCEDKQKNRESNDKIFNYSFATYSSKKFPNSNQNINTSNPNQNDEKALEELDLNSELIRKEREKYLKKIQKKMVHPLMENESFFNGQTTSNDCRQFQNYTTNFGANLDRNSENEDESYEKEEYVTSLEAGPGFDLICDSCRNDYKSLKRLTSSILSSSNLQSSCSYRYGHPNRGGEVEGFLSNNVSHTDLLELGKIYHNAQLQNHNQKNIEVLPAEIEKEPMEENIEKNEPNEQNESEIEPPQMNGDFSYDEINEFNDILKQMDKSNPKSTIKKSPQVHQSQPLEHPRDSNEVHPVHLDFKQIPFEEEKQKQEEGLSIEIDVEKNENQNESEEFSDFTQTLKEQSRTPKRCSIQKFDQFQSSVESTPNNGLSDQFEFSSKYTSTQGRISTSNNLTQRLKELTTKRGTCSRHHDEKIMNTSLSAFPQKNTTQSKATKINCNKSYGYLNPTKSSISKVKEFTKPKQIPNLKIPQPVRANKSMAPRTNGNKQNRNRNSGELRKKRFSEGIKELEQSRNKLLKININSNNECLGEDKEILQYLENLTASNRNSSTNRTTKKSNRYFSHQIEDEKEWSEKENCGMRMNTNPYSNSSHGSTSAYHTCLNTYQSNSNAPNSKINSGFQTANALTPSNQNIKRVCRINMNQIISHQSKESSLRPGKRYNIQDQLSSTSAINSSAYNFKKGFNDILNESKNCAKRAQSNIRLNVSRTNHIQNTSFQKSRCNNLLNLNVSGDISYKESIDKYQYFNNIINKKLTSLIKQVPPNLKEEKKSINESFKKSPYKTNGSNSSHQCNFCNYSFWSSKDNTKDQQETTKKMLGRNTANKLKSSQLKHSKTQKKYIHDPSEYQFSEQNESSYCIFNDLTKNSIQNSVSKNLLGTSINAHCTSNENLVSSPKLSSTSHFPLENIMLNEQYEIPIIVSTSSRNSTPLPANNVPDTFNPSFAQPFPMVEQIYDEPNKFKGTTNFGGCIVMGNNEDYAEKSEITEMMASISDMEEVKSYRIDGAHQKLHYLESKRKKPSNKLEKQTPKDPIFKTNPFQNDDKHSLSQRKESVVISKILEEIRKDNLLKNENAEDDESENMTGMSEFSSSCASGFGNIEENCSADIKYIGSIPTTSSQIKQNRVRTIAQLNSIKNHSEISFNQSSNSRNLKRIPSKISTMECSPINEEKGPIDTQILDNSITTTIAMAKRNDKSFILQPQAFKTSTSLPQWNHYHKKKNGNNSTCSKTDNFLQRVNDKLNQNEKLEGSKLIRKSKKIEKRPPIEDLLHSHRNHQAVSCNCMKCIFI